MSPVLSHLIAWGVPLAGTVVLALAWAALEEVLPRLRAFHHKGMARVRQLENRQAAASEEVAA